jgi:DNA-binding response OmpR family regulator
MLGTKILFLEDDHLYQDSIKDFLEDEDFIVDTCNDGQEFLNKIFENIYDLYIIDINVPQLNGIELMKTLDEYHDDTMKLVLTSFPNNLISSFKNGCDDFINKSSDIDELLLRIKALIKRAYHSHENFIKLSKELIYDLFEKKLYIDKKRVDIEVQSLLILDYLIKRRGNYVSNIELEEKTYPSNTESKSDVIRYHIWNLRNTLGKDLIISKKNYGYTLKPLDK